MMSQRSTQLLSVALGVLAFTALHAAAKEPKAGQKGIALELGKLEETEARTKLENPSYGYVGQLGSFVATKDAEAMGLLVVHQHPDLASKALGRTKLTCEGAKRLGNVDGWVFKTEWDGKAYPSKIFFSSERVYFGGGVNAYIAADYRDETGWVWKLHPLRRMPMVKDGATKEVKE
jgi:hypothetical protein